MRERELGGGEDGLVAWQEYDKWDVAFSEVVFGGASAHQPVFLDVEDPLLVEVAAHRGLDLTAAEAERELVSAVRGTLMLGAETVGGPVFHLHRVRLDSWNWRRRLATEHRTAAPPVIALLAVFARAAELMGQDETFSSNAYFPRLYQLLEIAPADQQRLAADYRRRAEPFWGALNTWLESLAGSGGLATAEAMGHRYVGIALSQALIRDADRQRLIDFFVASDLEPGLRLGADDIATYLESWVGAGHGSQSMKKLLRSSAGRHALAEAASLALLQWDGATPGRDSMTRIAAPPLLTARAVRGGLSAPKLRLGFALRGSLRGARALSATWRVTSTPGSVKPEVIMTTLTDRLLVPDLPVEIDEGSLLTGQLRIEPVGESGAGQAPVLRKPQPIVLLTYLDEAGLYVEVERARLFEPVMLLVNGSAKKPNGTPMFDIDDLLSEVAQPGFTKVASGVGLPEGWILYRDVVIARRHERGEFALDLLKPAQTSTLNVSGGFRMPGHAARWHADVALDVGAVAPLATAMTIQVLANNEETEETQIQQWTTDQAEFAASTAGIPLTPGSYRVELRATGAHKKSATESVATFTVCTSDEPRFRAESSPIGYVVKSTVGALAAVVLETVADIEVSVPIRGAVSTPTTMARRDHEPCESVWWSLEQRPVEPTVLAEPAPPESCAFTGRHHEVIETHYSGMRYDRAVCSGCGRVKLYRPIAPLRKTSAAPVATLRSTLEHLGTAHGPRLIRGDTFLDALVWLGGGEPYEIAHLVRQVDDSALAVDEVLRTLEALGHIDVARNHKTFEVESWAIAPRSLAGLEDGSWFLAGAWDRSSIDELDRVVRDADASLDADDDGWLPRRRLAGMDEPALRAAAQALEATVVPAAGRSLLGCLPPLSDAIARLPRTSVEGVFDAEWFNPSAASWMQVESIGEPGAYRLRKGFSRTYMFRTKDDVGQGTAVRATPQAVKHFATTSRPLVGYDPDSRTLFVPLGADLPGLYGRALALLTGQPPSRTANRPLLAYRSVPPDVAGALVTLIKEG